MLPTTKMLNIGETKTMNGSETCDWITMTQPVSPGSKRTTPLPQGQVLSSVYCCTVLNVEPGFLFCVWFKSWLTTILTLVNSNGAKWHQGICSRTCKKYAGYYQYTICALVILISLTSIIIIPEVCLTFVFPTNVILTSVFCCDLKIVTFF